MHADFLPVRDWFSVENQAGGIAVTDLKGDGTHDLIVFMIDNPPGLNRGVYQVGRSLDANGNVTGGWSGWIDVPNWFSWENQGGGIAVADLNGDGTHDLIVFMIDNPPGLNRGVYQVGRSLDANGNVTGGWSGWIDVPNWFSWENQGGGIAVADLNGDGTHDLIVFMIDNPPGLNRGVYQVGRSLDANGNVTGGWSGWIDVPEWFSWENQGAGVAVVNRGVENDLVVFAIDNPVGQNQAFYRILPGVNVNGASTADWSSWLGVPNWFSWENQGGSIAPVVSAGRHEIAVLLVDNPPGQNAGLYQFLPLDPDPPTQGSWEVLPYHSGVLDSRAPRPRRARTGGQSGAAAPLRRDRRPGGSTRCRGAAIGGRHPGRLAFHHEAAGAGGGRQRTKEQAMTETLDPLAETNTGRGVHRG